MLVLVVLVGVAVGTAVLLALVPVLVDVVEHQHAQSTADATALAGVRGGRARSLEIATANGATLVDWRRDGARVTVTVRVGDQAATAKATDEP